jgi:dihydrofolate reductase
MGKVRVCSFSISLDGYGAGPRQSLEEPMGARGSELHRWFLPTRTFKARIGAEGGTTGLDDELAARGFENVGAWILGRNMFGPVRGPWPDETWRGWWGDEPPYRVPVFVLTHHPRAPLEMKGGTVFHFVEGAEEALRLAREAAGSMDVRIGGGVATVREYLRLRAIDELHLAVGPALLGSGEHLFAGLDLHELGYHVVETVAGTGATHVTMERR